MYIYGYIWICISIDRYILVYVNLYGYVGVYLWVCMGFMGIWVCTLTVVNFTILNCVVLQFQYVSMLIYQDFIISVYEY